MAQKYWVGKKFCISITEKPKQIFWPTQCLLMMCWWVSTIDTMLLLSGNPFYSHIKQIFMHLGQYLCVSHASRNGIILIFLNSNHFSIFIPSCLLPSLSPTKIAKGSQAWTHSFSRLLYHSITSQSHRFYFCNDSITSTLILLSIFEI